MLDLVIFFCILSTLIVLFLIFIIQGAPNYSLKYFPMFIMQVSAIINLQWTKINLDDNLIIR
jgi:hypothetical protein